MYVKKATPEDFDQFYKLRTDQNNIYWSGHENAPDRDQLKGWYSRNLENQARTIFLYFEEESKEIIGYLYFDIISETEGEVAYGVLAGQNGKGYGTKINSHAIEFAKNNFPRMKRLYAWIAADNIGSIKCVEKNGYQDTSETKHVSFPKEESKFFKQFQVNIGV